MKPYYLLLSLIFALAVSLLRPAEISASEIDTFSARAVPLTDSLDALNTIVNERLQEGVQNANRRQDKGTLFLAPETCDPEILYTELRRAIFQSFTASLGLKGYDLDKQLRELLRNRSYSLPLQNSVYRDINYLEGLSLNLKELSDVVNISGNYVGLDKIGHFFAEGWDYFEMTSAADKELTDALTWGREKEEGMFGFTTTGIFSYADLVANLNGYRFWNRILLEHKDPLLNFWARLLDTPYITCNVQILASLRQWRLIRRWELQKHFDFSDYIDGAWDETNNCCSYASPAIAEKVTARIRELTPHLTCPVSAESCVEAGKKYGAAARYVLHPACMSRTPVSPAP